MNNNPRKYLIYFILGISSLVLIIALFRLPGSFSISSTSALKGSIGQFDSLTINVNKDLSSYSKSPSAVFKITPLVRGNIKIDGKKITFKPLGGFSPNTKYKVTITKINLKTGKGPSANTAFTAKADSSNPRTKFINSLPLNYPGYSINYLKSFGVFSVQINDVPVEKNKTEAFKLISSQGFTVKSNDVEYIVPAILQPNPYSGGD